MFDFDVKELSELKAARDMLRSLEKKTVEPLTEELMLALVKSFKDTMKFFKPEEGPNFIFEKPCYGACGCIGPQDNEPYCNCIMMSLRYEYCYDLALRLIEDGEEVPWSYDEYNTLCLIAMGR